MHEVSHLIGYEDKPIKGRKYNPQIKSNKQYTFEELQKIVHSREQEKFQRAWLPCSDIISKVKTGLFQAVDYIIN